MASDIAVPEDEQVMGMSLPLMAAALSSAAPDDVESLVTALGLQSNKSTVQAIGRFGCRAVPALVRQLGVVRVVRVLDHERDLHPREVRVVWTIAEQRAIIDQWRRYSASGACRNARPNPDFAFWLSGWRYSHLLMLSLNANDIASPATPVADPMRAYNGTVRIDDRDR